MKERALDARELEAPLPLEYAIKIATALQDGEYMKMIHRMKPCKLGDILDAIGIEYDYFALEDNHYVFAWRKGDEQTKKFVSQRLKDEYGRIISL